MKDYEPKEFLNALDERIIKKPIKCPYCGGRKFTSTDSSAAILISKKVSGLSVSSVEAYIPSGMLICENCGHMEFFALGSLGLNDKDDKDNADKSKSSQE